MECGERYLEAQSDRTIAEHVRGHGHLYSVLVFVCTEPRETEQRLFVLCEVIHLCFVVVLDDRDDLLTRLFGFAILSGFCGCPPAQLNALQATHASAPECAASS
jgi:hypothetical protein